MLASTGTRVRDSTSEPSSAKLNVKAMGEKMRFSTRWNVKIGRKAVMMISLEKTIGRPMRSATSASR